MYDYIETGLLFSLYGLNALCQIILYSFAQMLRRNDRRRLILQWPMRLVLLFHEIFGTKLSQYTKITGKA